MKRVLQTLTLEFGSLKLAFFLQLTVFYSLYSSSCRLQFHTVLLQFHTVCYSTEYTVYTVQYVTENTVCY